MRKKREMFRFVKRLIISGLVASGIAVATNVAIVKLMNILDEDESPQQESLFDYDR